MNSYFGKECGGGTFIDKCIHTARNFHRDRKNLNLVGMKIVDNCQVFYHEERIYSVYDTKNDRVAIVRANNPFAAIDKSGFAEKIEK